MPSGVYTANPDDGVSTEEEAGSGLTYGDALRFMYGANPTGPMKGGWLARRLLEEENSINNGGNPIRDKFEAEYGIGLGDTYDPNSDAWKKALDAVDADYRDDFTR